MTVICTDGNQVPRGEGKDAKAFLMLTRNDALAFNERRE